jgi:hypothetical protein
VVITQNLMKEELRLKGLPASGRKHELAKHLGIHLRGGGGVTSVGGVSSGTVDSNSVESAAKLATSEIVDDNDLAPEVDSDSDSEDEREEDDD